MQKGPRRHEGQRPGVERAPADDLQAGISREVNIVNELMRAGPELLGIVGSWGDTMDDDDVLADLICFNRTGSAFDGIEHDARDCMPWRPGESKQRFVLW